MHHLLTAVATAPLAVSDRCCLGKPGPRPSHGDSRIQRNHGSGQRHVLSAAGSPQPVGGARDNQTSRLTFNQAS
jgi:hypothetical protein